MYTHNIYLLQNIIARYYNAMFQEGKGCLNVNKFDITITIKDKKRVLKIDL